MMVSRRTYLLVSVLAAVVPIGVAALATTSWPWQPWLWWGSLAAYLGLLGWLRPTGGSRCWPSRPPSVRD
jgi:hypothetical protein